jgi:hypothetical protein
MKKPKLLILKHYEPEAKNFDEKSRLQETFHTKYCF